jgi:hypothetical protein
MPGSRLDGESNRKIPAVKFPLLNLALCPVRFDYGKRAAAPQFAACASFRFA